MSFELGTMVVTTAGTGRVVYAEDDYIEVEINGNEFSFESPFNGIESVRDIEYKARQAEDAQTAKMDQAFEDLSIDEKIAAKLNWMTATSLVQLLGGSAADWDELTSEQKLNYAKVKIS